ncbi:MAG: alpha/beta fold hydrolase [Pseudomonadaceae bacterium]|nr:alpha/beta fold hydrolase [Pseudomonadaceae bacterium]
MIITLALGITAFAITRPGELVTPIGQGSMSIDGREFEAFPLPDYVANKVTSGYKSYFIEVEPGIKVHMLEVGSGYPVFMQHGNPTSGLLYRRVVEALPIDQVRVIMPTLVGLGFSTKVPVFEHTVDNHIRWINAALGSLDLEELVFVGQDWGGPIGMGALAESPRLLKGAVIMNTGLNAPTEPMDLSTAHATAKAPITGELLLEVLFPITSRLSGAQGDPASMPDDVIALYERPLIDSGNDKAPLTMMRMVTDGPDHPSALAMQRIESYVTSLAIPVELVWGMKDPILGKSLPNMRANFPGAPVLETDAGHFLQEEVPEEIAAAVMRVVAKAKAPG